MCRPVLTLSYVASSDGLTAADSLDRRCTRVRIRLPGRGGGTQIVRVVYAAIRRGLSSDHRPVRIDVGDDVHVQCA